MSRFLLLVIWIFINYYTSFSSFAYIENIIPIITENPFEKTNITYFTALKDSDYLNLSHEKSLFFHSDDCLQRDTSKNKLPLLDKGAEQQKTEQIINHEIDGLLLDMTFSPGGYDFYVDFSQHWTPPKEVMDYNIIVKEYPGRGAIIIVAIEINGKQLVYRRMRPTYPVIHNLAVAASNYLSGYLSRGDHLRGIDADGNFIDVQRTDVTRRYKTPFDIY